MENPQEEADKLRKEAKDLLNNLFCGALGIKPTDDDIVSISLSGVDRAVDCIVGAAILETSAIMAASMPELRKAS